MNASDRECRDRVLAACWATWGLRRARAAGARRTDDATPAWWWTGRGSACCRRSFPASSCPFRGAAPRTLCADAAVAVQWIRACWTTVWSGISVKWVSTNLYPTDSGLTHLLHDLSPDGGTYPTILCTGWSDVIYLWSQCNRHFVGQHVVLCVVKWWRFVALYEQNWISWFKKMSVLSLSYWESDVYWRQNNKHFAELAPPNGGKQLIWRNYVTVTLCILQTSSSCPWN